MAPMTRLCEYTKNQAERWPHLAGRLAKAISLVRGGVKDHGPVLGWEIASRKPGHSYWLLGAHDSCSCEHSRYGRRGPCSHRLAVRLMEILKGYEAEAEMERLARSEGVPAQEPAPAPYQGWDPHLASWHMEQARLRAQYAARTGQEVSDE